eukprot:6589358-Pyramimonas_sp.AAC.1
MSTGELKSKAFLAVDSGACITLVLCVPEMPAGAVQRGRKDGSVRASGLYYHPPFGKKPEHQTE